MRESSTCHLLISVKKTLSLVCMLHKQTRAGAGTIRGAHHSLRGQNNQDAFVHWRGPELAVGVVCDGCGSAPASEVGAQVLAHVVAHQARDLAPEHDIATSAFLDGLSEAVCARLRAAVEGLGLPLEYCVHTWFLATIVGYLVTPKTTLIFAAGDGYARVNDTLHVLGPFADNAPPYLAYRLLGNQTGLSPVACLPTAQLHTVVIASDGASELLVDTNELALFCEQPRFVDHPDALRRYLYQRARGDGRYGQRLHDDTTVAVLRRIEGE